VRTEIFRNGEKYKADKNDKQQIIKLPQTLAGQSTESDWEASAGVGAAALAAAKLHHSSPASAAGVVAILQALQPDLLQKTWKRTYPIVLNFSQVIAEQKS
jgi:hypothetical protein